MVIIVVAMTTRSLNINRVLILEVTKEWFEMKNFVVQPHLESKVFLPVYTGSMLS